MKFSTLEIADRVIWGVVGGDYVIDVTSCYPDLRSAIAAGPLDRLATSLDGAPRHPLEKATFLPVIPNPDKVLCIGLNYKTH